MIPTDSIGNSSMSQVEFWIWIGILAAAVTILLAWAIGRARQNAALNGRALFLCAILYLLCCGAAIASGVFAHKLRLNADALARPTAVVPIAADWRADLDLPERTRLTKILAKSVYVSNGVIVSYISSNGALIPFEPTTEDKKDRQSAVQKIAWTESFAVQAFFASIVWLFVPLFALLLSTMISRSKRP